MHFFVNTNVTKVRLFSIFFQLAVIQLIKFSKNLQKTQRFWDGKYIF